MAQITDKAQKASQPIAPADQRRSADPWMLQMLRGKVLHQLGRPSFDPFSSLTPDPGRRARNLAKPAARTCYAIVFTPRSGSSRLQDILESAPGLSNPGEHFNPGFLPAMAKYWHAGSMEDYVAMLRRFRNDRGTMGFEATWSHIQRCFGSAERFAAVVAPDAWVWLLREDIVLQAVSISRMVQTQIAHKVPGVTEAHLMEADMRFTYSGFDIAKRVLGMRTLERNSEAMFTRLGARPLRLSYERIIAMEPAAVVDMFARHVGIKVPRDFEIRIRHSKLGTDKNIEFAQRFRAAHPAFVAMVERSRRPMLAALDDVGQGC